MTKPKIHESWKALDKVAGIFKDDTEWDEILRETRKGWKAWTKRAEKETKLEK